MSEGINKESLNENLSINGFQNTYSKWEKEINGSRGESLNVPLEQLKNINSVVKQKVKAKILIKNIVGIKTDEKAKCGLTLEQVLEADDLFNFLDNDNPKELEKILDVGYYIEKTEDTKVFNPDKMKELADCMLKRTDILNNLEKAKMVLMFYYQILPNLIDRKIKEYARKTNDLKCRYLKKSTPMFSFAYELLKKYKDRSENDFNELKKYVGKITSDILKETSDWSDAISVFFDLKNFYDRKKSAQLSLNCNLNRRLNEMLNFLYKNRIIKNLTAVTKFSVLENEEFSCSWSEWFRELWRCLRDDFLTFWKNSST